MLNKVKENWSSLGVLLTAIGTIIGVFLTVDTRYAHSDEVTKLKKEQQQVIKQNRYDLSQSTNLLRKQSLEDKIFDIELIPNSTRSQYDKARLEKYKSDLNEVNQILRQPSPLLDTPK